jgi:hypothetical protein
MAGREYWEQWERETGAMEVVASELVVTTAGNAEVREYAPLAGLFERVRNAFGVEMAFVSEWCGEPVVRTRPGADALHALYGRQYLESRAPAGAAFRIDALPVVAGDGQAHGTLCVRQPLRSGNDPQFDDLPRSVAGLVANWFAAAAC